MHNDKSGVIKPPEVSYEIQAHKQILSPAFLQSYVSMKKLSGS